MTKGDKNDRTARLVAVEHLLYQYSKGGAGGAHPRDIAKACGVTVRTVYRDLKAIEFELHVPLWNDAAGRYGVDCNRYIPPIRITRSEAMALYIASRLYSKYSDERDPAITSILTKLASVLPSPIADYVRETVVEITSRGDNEHFARIFEMLTTAWAERRRVRMSYPWTSPHGSVTKHYDRLLDPYFIEPMATAHACYVIGRDGNSGEVRTFKIERISELELTAEHFEIPADWNIRDYLHSSWGIFTGGEVEVRVRFSQAVAARIKETIWHPSQVLEDQPEGGLLFTARVAGITEITPWVLSWGNEAEAISPPELRQRCHEVALGRRECYEQPTGINAALEPQTPPQSVVTL